MDIDDIMATSLKSYSKKIADNITKEHPLFHILKKKGNMNIADGGTSIVETLEVNLNQTVKWFSGYETLDISPSEILAEAEYDWRQLSANVTWSGLDKIKNSGKSRIHNFVTTKIKNAEKSMQNEMGMAVFYSNTENDGKSIGGLQHLISDNPEVGTIGGINAADHIWWRNQKVSVNGYTGSAASKDTIVQAMNKMGIACKRGSDKIDLICADENFYLFFLESIQEKQRFTNASLAKVGFETVRHWGSGGDVFYDSECPEDHMYFINSDYIRLRPAKGVNFTMGEKEKALGQDAWTRPFMWAGNMTCSNRGMQGVLVA
ncbi:MAG: phage major capsid protein [Hyphomicrobiales bacterium]